jgi:hypothetical protein
MSFSVIVVASAMLLVVDASSCCCDLGLSVSFSAGDFWDSVALSVAADVDSVGAIIVGSFSVSSSFSFVVEL